MSVSIIEVHTKSELKEWVLFPFRFYREDPYYVPQIIREEMDFFSADRNPGFKVAETKLLLAQQSGKTVGRICGIIHKLEEAKLGYKRGRFGWFECADDAEAAASHRIVVRRKPPGPPTIDRYILRYPFFCLILRFDSHLFRPRQPIFPFF